MTGITKGNKSKFEKLQTHKGHYPDSSSSCACIPKRPFQIQFYGNDLKFQFGCSQNYFTSVDGLVNVEWRCEFVSERTARDSRRCWNLCSIMFGFGSSFLWGFLRSRHSRVRRHYKFSQDGFMQFLLWQGHESHFLYCFTKNFCVADRCVRS